MTSNDGCKLSSLERSVLFDGEANLGGEGPFEPSAWAQHAANCAACAEELRTWQLARTRLGSVRTALPARPHFTERVLADISRRVPSLSDVRAGSMWRSFALRLLPLSSLALLAAVALLRGGGDENARPGFEDGVLTNGMVEVATVSQPSGGGAADSDPLEAFLGTALVEVEP